MSIRNIAIIAHVDHGKTTLVDQLLRQSGTFALHEKIEDRVMDSGDLEKERGITILAKCTSIDYSGHTINIIDTPGHADFGGEVERVLSMVDGVILLVDAAEGPMPQTKFVLSKALALGLEPIVVVNKVDRNDARPKEVLNEIFDLFINLDANEEQLEFPVLYAVGRDGWCVKNLGDEEKDMRLLMDLVLEHVREPNVDLKAPFSMLATILDYNPYVGRMLIGKVQGGRATMNMPIKAINLAGETVERGRLTKMFVFRGIKKVSVENVEAGDIVSIAGLERATVADTICDPLVTEPIKSTAITAPTMSITISVNDSPFAGKEGTKVTSRFLRDRLFAEQESNVAITVRETGDMDSFEIGGRGELQLGILIETMRREGYEMAIGKPKVLFRVDENGNKLEPIEEVVIDIDEKFSGPVVDKLSRRKGELKEMRPCGYGRTRIVMIVPSRGLMGYQSEFMTDTRGSGVLHKIFHSYQEYKGEIPNSRKGVLISNGQGEAIPYALFNIQERGIMFIGPHDKVYDGMIVGEHARDNDLIVNVLRTKKLTNVRAAGSDENIILTPPHQMSLEQMITYIGDDELLEVTPKNLRLRKKYLSANDRKKYSKVEEEG
ncbi:MAG: translational GTPase TypA [Rickettsiales bacterium]|jgi:GTP-binding protein|nr:translational GTPase TypA [Rickettsiales bacterium]